MIANYGYKDGSGEFFITIDTDQCDGCGACAEACPADCFEVGEDPIDPLRDEPVAFVSEAVRKKIKYACGACKPVTDRPPLPCVQACPRGVISHSW
ncbi:MAG: 4Fe-4S binding protein [Proteobacteria bacterium]|nr:4Fe-4S binding protein [Pseudomonadota bacterium]